MSPWLIKLLGINWGTTLAGLSLIAAAVGRIGVAWKAKDFQAVFTDAQFVLSELAIILTAFGLIAAKDRNVTGAGTQAKAVDTSTGKVVNVEGQPLGKQSPVPPAPIPVK